VCSLNRVEREVPCGFGSSSLLLRFSYSPCCVARPGSKETVLPVVDSATSPALRFAMLSAPSRIRTDSSRERVWTGRWRSVPLVRRETERTTPSGPGKTFVTRPVGQKPRGLDESMMTTMSPTSRFGCCCCHFPLLLRLGMTSYIQRRQNCSTNACATRHFRLADRSFSVKTSGGRFGHARPRSR
jgi:hypothetical protein